jgi:DNA-binding MarR family transcriptional regulator
MAQAVEMDVAGRLRIGVMRLARLLRPTDAGTAADLSPTRVTVLLNAVRNRPVRLAQVAEEEGLNPTLLSRTVASLADAGLVIRSADPDDRRSAWLEPTEAGLALAVRIRAERTALVKAALDSLSEDDQANLEAALPAIEALSEALGA